jgi:hypothetical protein
VHRLSCLCSTMVFIEVVHPLINSTARIAMTTNPPVMILLVFKFLPPVP